MKKRKQIVAILGLCLSISGLLMYPYRVYLKNKLKAFIGYSSSTAPGSAKCVGCYEAFTDNVSMHQKAYSRGKGISPQADEAGLKKLYKNAKLVKIETSEYYIVRKLRFSKPYILQKGADFLEALGASYYKKCQADSIQYIPFTISSMTRSKESVKSLMEGNGNAIENSAHLRGKTFDISYRAFDEHQQQSKLFIKSLQELRSMDRCFVKFERNGCLHITVN